MQYVVELHRKLRGRVVRLLHKLNMRKRGGKSMHASLAALSSASGEGEMDWLDVPRRKEWPTGVLVTAHLLMSVLLGAALTFVDLAPDDLLARLDCPSHLVRQKAQARNGMQFPAACCQVSPWSAPGPTVSCLPPSKGA